MNKKIVLLSDGTGNSAAKVARTNVWRTYQAVDFSNEDQIGIYDDGVGTSSFKPFAILGGAFGWGLKRNVLHLYKFLCRNYVEGDQIYAFGFSRGAFTIRVLVGFVLNQGLVRWHSEEELDYLAKSAYRHYRSSSYKAHWFSLSLVGRVVRDAWIWLRDRIYRQEGYTEDKNRGIRSIEFLGLWDTVDAYGMPIRELKIAIDKFIWPLYFDSNKVDEHVHCARHALSLDDERATFHPLVWDESGEKPGSKRIEQFWFAGVHSDVGGGYPDDALSYVSLNWMLCEAENAGLRLKPSVVTQYQLAASPYGKMHDSRAGISAYYRYAPRRVEEVTQTPNIHPSVDDRIKHGNDQYAPISLAASSGHLQRAELVWDTVWWRRVAYWAMATFTATLFALMWIEPEEGNAQLGGFDKYLRDPINRLLDVVTWVTPNIVHGWIDNLRERPTLVAILLLAIAVTFWWGILLKGRIRDRAAQMWGARLPENWRIWTRQSQRRWQKATSWFLFGAAAAFGLTFMPDTRMGEFPFWLAVLLLGVAILCLAMNYYRTLRLEAKTKTTTESRGLGLALAHLLRHSGPLTTLWNGFSNGLVPFAFAMLLLFAGVHLVNRTGFALLTVGGAIYPSAGSPTPLPLNRPRELKFPTNHACFSTNLLIERNAEYLVEMKIDEGEPWKDGKHIKVKDLNGFSSTDADVPWYVMLPASALRRHIGDDWFKPMAHIGKNSLTEYALGARTKLRETSTSGELFLFVNDAVVAWPWGWDRFYRNNEGIARVTVTKIADAAD